MRRSSRIPVPSVKLRGTDAEERLLQGVFGGGRGGNDEEDEEQLWAAAEVVVEELEGEELAGDEEPPGLLVQESEGEDSDEEEDVEEGRNRHINVAADFFTPPAPAEGTQGQRDAEEREEEVPGGAQSQDDPLQ